MADQLRWDYLSCYGHPHLRTPNIDSLAKKGVMFESAYVQAPVCGPSRASYYTGRTVFSHGSTWNQVPLPIGELTIGDYLRQSGIRTGVVGKTHMRPDTEGMNRLGISKNTEIGLIVSEPGFDPYERDDGLHPNNQIKNSSKKLSYNQWLNKLGYDGENPWDSWANSSEGKNGEILKINEESDLQKSVIISEQYVKIEGWMADNNQGELDSIFLIMDDEPFLRYDDFLEYTKNQSSIKSKWIITFLSGYLTEGCHDISIVGIKDSKLLSMKQEVSICKNNEL